MPAEEIAHEICDWMSFGFKNGDLLNIGSYYQMNKGRMLMSPKTRKSLEERLQMLVYKINELEGPNISDENFSQADKIDHDKMSKTIEEAAINKHSRKINEDSELNLLLDLYDEEILNESPESKKAREDRKKFKLFKYCIKFLTEDSLAEILKTSKHAVPSGKREKVKAVRELLSNMSENKKEKIVNSEVMNTIYGTVKRRLKGVVGFSAGVFGASALLAKDGAEVLASTVLLMPSAFVGLGILALSLLSAGLKVTNSLERAKRKISLESSNEIKRIILDDIKEVE